MEKSLPDIERIIGEYGNAGTGPLVIAMSGLHGNEHGGVAASRRVVEVLRETQPAMQGRFIAVVGNLTALARNERYLETDLNRMWSAEHVARLRESPSTNGNPEEHEQRALLNVFDPLLDGHDGPVVFLDLHSTSAASSPFCIVSDTLQNRKIAFALGVPVILGLEEAISGTIQEFFGERGFVTLAIEGGQHFAPETADRLESAVWVALRATGALRRRQIPQWRLHRSRLLDVSDGMPSVVEVFFRHGLTPEDGFKMRDGFRNFSPIHRGELVAHDDAGGIVAPEDGMLILPSYQGIGDDGFFVGRHVRRFWLRLSAWVRRLGIDHLIHLLPGVSRDPADPRVLVADQRVARWRVQEIFHLAGYRKCRTDNKLMCFRRRRERP